MTAQTNIVPVQGNASMQRAANVLVPTTMDQAMRLAEIMAKGSLVPKHLHGNPGNCFLVIEQAMRWGMSPFAVAQCTFLVKDKLGFEGKLVAAAVENSGAIEGLLDYQLIGDPKDLQTRGIVVSATRRGEPMPRTVEVMWRDVKTTNEQWTKQPDQQLVYHGTRVWARRWTASVILGVYTREELHDPARFDGPTIDLVADAASDNEPAESEERKPQAKPLEYPMTTTRWSKVFDNPVEWHDAWTKLIRNCVAAEALDKLRAAYRMNEGAFVAISEFDRETAEAVQENIDSALTQSGGSSGTHEEAA